MNIVTLTTDYGCSDYYAGALKSKLMQVSSDINIVDITHQIQPFHYGAAAFQVYNALKFFPAETIHFIDVSFSYEQDKPFLIMRVMDQYICSCDTGVFSVILDGQQPQDLRRIYTIDFVKHPSFPAIDIFPAVAQAIVVDKDLDKVSEPFNEIQHAETLKPIIYDKMIRAAVIHIDHYQNIILNVKRDEFERICKDRKYVISVRRSVETEQISQSYSAVSLREVAAVFNANNYLELALHQGNMAELNGVSIGDSIQIDFL
jgi:hypothetical protein